MDNRQQVSDFLRSRRAKVSPASAGIRDAGRRRVPGLRRSEVASLAGMSVEYYAKLERGELAGASAGVLESLAVALQLDEAERLHLLRLAQEAAGTARIVRRERPRAWSVRPTLQWTLDAITVPALVGNDRLDLLAANHLGRALYSDLVTHPVGRPNFARFTFLDSAARRFHPDWRAAADTSVANLRTAVGKDPSDPELAALVAELATKSDEFRKRWTAHDVRTHGSGVKRFHHPVVGDLELRYESLDLRAEPGLTLTVYSAEPASPTAHALVMLASWAASEEFTPAALTTRAR